MTIINNGGPAFPILDPMALSPANVSDMERFAHGMTLRDYFAAKAMAGICSHRDTWGCGINEIGIKAYEVADHMLKARGV